LRRAASASRLQNRGASVSSASSVTGLLQPSWVDAKPHRPLSPRRERERQRRQEAAVAAAQARQSSRSRVPAARAAASGARLHNIASKRAGALEAARQRSEHTFSPQITRKARELDKQRSQSVEPGRQGGGQSRFHSLYQDAVAQRKRVAEKARKLSQDPEATFQPNITAKARKLSRSASAEPSRPGNDVSRTAGNRLYAAAKSQQRTLEAKREAAARASGSAFRPHLNRKSLAMAGGSPAPGTPPRAGDVGARSTPGSKRKPLYDANALKASQDRLAATRSKLELASCTFSPATNHNSTFSGREARPVSRASSRSSSRGKQSTDGDAKPAHDRLLEAGKRTNAAREAKLRAARQAERDQPFRPTLDNKSRRIAQQARQRQQAAIQAVTQADFAPSAGSNTPGGPDGSHAAPDAAAVETPLGISDADRAAGERAAGLAAAGMADEALAATMGSQAAAQYAADILNRASLSRTVGEDSAGKTAFDRLYSQQWLLQAKKHAAEESARASEVQSLAPKPAISAHSAELAAARLQQGSKQPVWQRLYAEQWKDRSALELAREAKEAAELAKCTFQPTLHPDSFANTVENGHADAAPVWDRLYADSFHAREVERQRLEAAERRARVLSTAAPRRLQAMREDFEAATGRSVHSLADSDEVGGSSIFDALYSHAETRRSAIERQERRNALEARRMSATISPRGNYKELMEGATEKAKLAKRRQLAARRASLTHAVNPSSLASPPSSAASVRSVSSSRRPPHTPQRRVSSPASHRVLSPALAPAPVTAQLSPPPKAGSVASDDSSITGSQQSAEPRSLLQRRADNAPPGKDSSFMLGHTLEAVTGVLAGQAAKTPPPVSPTADAVTLPSNAALHPKASWAPVASSSQRPAAASRGKSGLSSASSTSSASPAASLASSASSSPIQSRRSSAGGSTRGGVVTLTPAAPPARQSSAATGRRASEPGGVPAAQVGKALSPLAAAATATAGHNVAAASRSISEGGTHSPASSAHATAATAGHGPPPPLPPKRHMSAPRSPASVTSTVSRPGTPEHKPKSPSSYAFPVVPPTVPAPQVASPRSHASGGQADGARSAVPSQTSSTDSSMRGLPPPRPPKKVKPVTLPTSGQDSQAATQPTAGFSYAQAAASSAAAPVPAAGDTPVEVASVDDGPAAPREDSPATTGELQTAAGAQGTASSSDDEGSSEDHDSFRAEGFPKPATFALASEKKPQANMPASAN